MPSLKPGADQMARIEVPGIHRVVSKGKIYFYAWRGGPRIKSLPGTDAFVREVVERRAERKQGEAGRISGLIVEWRNSPSWTAEPHLGGLSPSTKKNWMRWLDEIADHFGPLRIKHFERPEIRRDIKRWRDKWRGTPRAADMAKQVLSALLSHAVEEGQLSSNPCFGIANLYSNDRSGLIWTEEDVTNFVRSAPKELSFALRLACLTGLRQGDLLKLAWGHIGAQTIEMRTAKSKGRLSYTVPLYPALQELLDEIRLHQRVRVVELTTAAKKKGKPPPPTPTTVLTTRNCRPWGKGFGASWNAAKNVAGVGQLNFHDARGTAATRFYLAKFTNQEIAEILGWSPNRVEGIIKRYVTRDALLQDQIRRMHANANGTGV